MGGGPIRRRPEAHICGTDTFAPGDPIPDGYTDRHEWAQVQLRAGDKQRRCRRCSLWHFHCEKHDCTPPAEEE